MLEKGYLFLKTIQLDKKVASTILYNYRPNTDRFYANIKSWSNNIFLVLYPNKENQTISNASKLRKSLKRLVSKGFLKAEKTRKKGTPMCYTLVDNVGLANEYKIPLNHNKDKNMLDNFTFNDTISTKAAISLLSIINDFDSRQRFSCNEVVEKWDEAYGKLTSLQISSALDILVRHGFLSQICDSYKYEVNDKNLFNELTMKWRRYIVNSTSLNSNDFTLAIKLIYEKESFFLNDMFKKLTEAGYEITVDEMTALMNHLVWHNIYVNEENSTFYKRGKNSITFAKTEDSSKDETNNPSPKEKTMEENKKLEETTPVLPPGLTNVQIGNGIVALLKHNREVHENLKDYHGITLNALNTAKATIVKLKKEIESLTTDNANLSSTINGLNDTIEELKLSNSKLQDEISKKVEVEEEIETLELKPLS